MHLADITRLRTVPAAAVYLALTRRCPLSCAHCSTESSMRSEQYPADPFHRLVDSFGAADRPEMICMSGGEALLRADLVRRLSARAHEVGTGVLLLSGMYFARGGRAIPAAVRDAVRGVDHFSASLDAYHEREVDRREVFRALRRIREWGPQVSLHITGLDDDDPYVAGLVADVRREFADQVPMIVNHVSPVGRARSWLRRTSGPQGPTAPPSDPGPGPEADPCSRATWPLVDYDGTVFACCNQDLLQRHQPPHLVLGDAAHDPWPVLRERFLSRHLLRMVRIVGPLQTMQHFGGCGTAGGAGGEDYCGTCIRLSDDPATAERAGSYLRSRSGTAFEIAARPLVENPGPRGFVKRLGSRRYAELVTLGWKGGDRCAG